MQKLRVSELKEHPQNTYFFDDMEGEKWKEFLESVRTSGVIEPIICTQDKVIVSGHQRVKACEELGIEEVDCEVRIYENEDKVIKDLLETNVRQRGDVGGSSVKVGRRIKELERLYGVKHGGDRTSKIANGNFGISKSDLAEQLGLNEDTYNRYKKLTTLIPELQEMVDDKISPSVASRILAKLSQEEQQDLINTYGKEIVENLSMAKAKELIDEYKNQTLQASQITAELATKNKELTQKVNELSSLETEINKLKEELDNRPTIEKEVRPSDYDSTKKMLNDYKADYKNLQKQYEEKANEVNKIKRDLETIKQNTPEEQYNKKIKDSTIFFCARISEFLEKVGGYVWIVDHINELPEYEKKSYYSAVNAISAWSENLRDNIK